MPVQPARLEEPRPQPLPVPTRPPIPPPRDVVTLGAAPPLGKAPRPQPSPEVPGPLEEAARQEAEADVDRRRAEEILAQMAVERRRSEERIRLMWAALEIECLRLWQEVMLERQKVMDALFEKWCKILLG